MLSNAISRNLTLSAPAVLLDQPGQTRRPKPSPLSATGGGGGGHHHLASMAATERDGGAHAVWPARVDGGDGYVGRGASVWLLGCASSGGGIPALMEQPRYSHSGLAAWPAHCLGSGCGCRVRGAPVRCPLRGPGRAGAELEGTQHH